MARGQSTFNRSPLHLRFSEFSDGYNETQEHLRDKIRCSKLHTAKIILYAYYNKNYNAEIKNWNDQNPAFLPALAFNNVETIERLGMEVTSTAWRAMTFLCKLNLGENRGLFMKKKFCGFCQDYLIHVNPYILTGQIVENWGLKDEKSWVAPKSDKLSTKISPSFKIWGEGQPKKSKKQNFEAVENGFNLPLVANCNPPTIAGTDNNIKNTTTKVCGLVDNVQSDEQEQLTGTEVGSIGINPLLKKYLEQTSRTFTQPGAAAVISTQTATGEAKRAKFYGVSSPQNRANVHNESSTIGKNEPQKPENTVRTHALSLVLEFYKYSMPLLFPNFKVHNLQQQKDILNMIWRNWYKDYALNPNCTIEIIDRVHEELKEAVIISLQEVATKKGAYICANPLKFFDLNFKAGLYRAAQQWKKTRLNKDRAVLLKAKRSISSGKIPRNIKNIVSLMDLVAYWRQHFERVCFTPKIIQNDFSHFLTNPKNHPKNGTRLQ